MIIRLVFPRLMTNHPSPTPELPWIPAFNTSNGSRLPTLFLLLFKIFTLVHPLFPLFMFLAHSCIWLRQLAAFEDCCHPCCPRLMTFLTQSSSGVIFLCFPDSFRMVLSYFVSLSLMVFTGLVLMAHFIPCLIYGFGAGFLSLVFTLHLLCICQRAAVF